MFLRLQVTLDAGTPTPLPDSPKMTPQGSVLIVTIHVPRFNSSAKYDTLFEPGQTAMAPAGSEPNDKTSVAAPRPATPAGIVGLFAAAALYLASRK